MVQKAGTYKELILEDILIQNRYSYDDELTDLPAGGVYKTYITGKLDIY
jgi:hypothetical protein